jgi:phosphoglycolate phosphatase
MNRLREVIFDLDGTLLDSLPGIEWSVRQACAACGIAAPRQSLRPYLGPPIRSILRSAAGVSAPDKLDRLERAFRVSYDGAGWRMTTCFDGAPAALDRLRRQGLRLWVATNKPARATGKILRELQIDALFEEIACRDSRTPPFLSKAELLIDLVERRGLRRAHCLMIGDTGEDGQAAAAAGIACTLVPEVLDSPALERILVNAHD